MWTLHSYKKRREIRYSIERGTIVPLFLYIFIGKGRHRGYNEKKIWREGFYYGKKYQCGYSWGG